MARWRANSKQWPINVLAERSASISLVMKVAVIVDHFENLKIDNFLVDISLVLEVRDRCFD